MADQRTRVHSRALDGLRGVAILGVIAFHIVPEVFPGGALGVDLFFALSGFLITDLLLQEIREHGRIDYVSFYLRRAFRLVPALLVFIAIAIAISVRLGLTHIGSDAAKVLLYVADFATSGLILGPLPPPWAHTWSLAVEEQFYLIWPVVLAWMLKRGWTRTWVFAPTCLVGGLAAFGISDRALGEGQTYFLPTGHLWALAAGIVVAIELRRTWSHVVRPWTTTLAWTALAVLVVSEHGTASFVVRSMEVLVASAALVAILVDIRAETSSRLLQNSFLVWFGTRSYGLYLFHTALIAVLVRPIDALPRSANAVLGLVLACALAEASYQLVETPVRAHGRAWLMTRRSRHAADQHY